MARASVTFKESRPVDKYGGFTLSLYKNTPFYQQSRQYICHAAKYSSHLTEHLAGVFLTWESHLFLPNALMIFLLAPHLIGWVPSTPLQVFDWANISPSAGLEWVNHYEGILSPSNCLLGSILPTNIRVNSPHQGVLPVHSWLHGLGTTPTPSLHLPMTQQW